MGTVVVTGAAGGVGRRVVHALAEHSRVVALDRVDPGHREPGVEVGVADLAHVDLKPLLEGADAVVHLARATDGSTAALTARVLDAAGSAGVGLVVVRSSATVYGAWPTNPVPLTEEAPVRPNPGFAFAAEQAEGERLLHEWLDEHPEAAGCVLRAALVVDETGGEWLAHTLVGPSAGPPPPAQFLHAEDLAGAVVHAVEQRLAGTYNVAADGWIAGDQVQPLRGGLHLPLPERVGGVVGRAAWRVGASPTPPAALPWTTHPWVVANDRLRATGWQPAWSNEEALVAASRGSWWRELSPRRRQELTLAASGVGLAALAGGAVSALAAARRRSRR